MCYLPLYNNTCSFCIFIGRELCVIKVHTHGWRQLMAWSNLANLFRGSLDCVSCVLFCSSHAMTSSVIYYSTDGRKNEIYLLSDVHIVLKYQSNLIHCKEQVNLCTERFHLQSTDLRAITISWNFLIYEQQPWCQYLYESDQRKGKTELYFQKL